MKTDQQLALATFAATALARKRAYLNARAADETRKANVKQRNRKQNKAARAARKRNR